METEVDETHPSCPRNSNCMCELSSDISKEAQRSWQPFIHGVSTIPHPDVTCIEEDQSAVLQIPTYGRYHGKSFLALSGVLVYPQRCFIPASDNANAQLRVILL